MDQIGENVKDSVRGFYNMIDSRAKMIARTEVTSAMNGGSLLYYKAIGATGKVWITANDEAVRETHRACQDQGEIGIDQVFDANSMQAPGMGNEPGEVINCRCSLKPTFK
jgi:SPP1 gp7 family putative phage head morphogenesis protein